MFVIIEAPSTHASFFQTRILIRNFAEKTIAMLYVLPS